MEITRKAEYAIRILSYLAAKDTGENVPSALIAEEQEIGQSRTRSWWRL